MTETGKPLVTVVILTYNQERFVGQAIESAVGQVCDFPFEVLVVDDCSTDGTADVCRSYAERYPQTVKFVRNEKNKGLIDYYFDTLLSVKTPYIADCAGDDYWCDSHKLQRQVDILERNPEVVLVHADFCSYNEWTRQWEKRGCPVEKPQRATFDDNVYELLNQAGCPFVFVGAACFRNDAFRRAYMQNERFFRNKEYACEDFQLVFLLLREGEFRYERLETAVYRTGESVSHSEDDGKTLNFLYRVYMLRTDLMQTFGMDANRCSNFMERYLRSILSHCICQKKTDIAADVVSRMRRLHYRGSWRLRLYAAISKNSLLSALFCQLKGKNKRKNPK